MTQAAAAVVRGQIAVDAPIEKAFAVFTERSATSSRPSTTCSGHRSPRRCSSRESAATSTIAALTAASAAGPASWSTSPRGASCSAGTSALRWQIETEPDNTSEVEVRFVAESRERTRVELEHSNIDRHGPGWEAVSDGVGHDAGWPLYLERYAALLRGGS